MPAVPEPAPGTGPSPIQVLPPTRIPPGVNRSILLPSFCRSPYSANPSARNLSNHQSSPGSLAVGAVGLRAEAVERGQRAGGSDLEDRARSIRSAEKSCAVEATIGSLDEAGDGLAAVSAVRLSAGVVSGLKGLRWREYRSHAEQQDDDETSG